MQIIDLSIPLANGLQCDPPLSEPHIDYHTHDQGVGEMAFAFPRLKPEHLPSGTGWATETLTVHTHSGTHMDAPWHFAPVMDREIGEKRAWTIDEVPLDWCVGPLVVLDFSDLEDGYVVQPADIDVKLDTLKHVLQQGEIVCIHTNAPQYFGMVDYVNHGVGVGKEGTLHILRQGIHVVGTDAWSWDAPFSLTAVKWRESLKAKQPATELIWEGHYAGIERGYFQLEKLANLDQVPPIGATIYCFPVKITGASAGWVRAVATIPEEGT